MYSQYRSVNVALCLELRPERRRSQAQPIREPDDGTLHGRDHADGGTQRAGAHGRSSNLGQMLSRLCIEQQIPLVNIVRKPDQEAMLRALVPSTSANSTSAGFMAELTGALTATGATLAFDAIGGGRLASQILTAWKPPLAPPRAATADTGRAVYKQVYIYGSLDRGPTELTRSYGTAWASAGGC